MILNSKQRRRIAKQKRAGQVALINHRQALMDSGIDEEAASQQAINGMAPGSKPDQSWWADVNWLRSLKRKKKAPVEGEDVVVCVS